MAGKNQSHYFLSIISFVLLYAVFGFLYALDKRDTNNGLYEIFRDKTLAANRTMGDSRILLLGGSNAVWGLRSQVIEDATTIPTFNMALIHEAYEPRAMRELALSMVRRGDIVVYSSASFWNSRGTDPDAALKLLELAGLQSREQTVMQKFTRTMADVWSPIPQRSTMIKSLDPLYRRYILQQASPHSKDLNPKGDLASCSKTGPVGPAGFATPPATEDLLQLLQNFENALGARGAKLVLVFPTMLIVPEQRQMWIDAYTPLLHFMQDLFIVATPDIGSVLSTDENLFCDSGFHPGNAEAENRSHTLGKFLNSQRKVLQKTATY